MKNKGNAKSQYSKQQILNALLVIMDNKPIYKITIKEICDYALISRKTFYRNFDTKIDVLSIEVDKIVEEYLNRLGMMDDLIVSNIALIIFNLVNENLYFFKKLVDNNMLYLVTDKLLKEIITVYRVRKKYLFDEFGEKSIENTLVFSFGGFTNYIERWVKNYNRITPQQIKKEFIDVSKIISVSI